MKLFLKRLVLILLIIPSILGFYFLYKSNHYLVDLSMACIALLAIGYYYLERMEDEPLFLVFLVLIILAYLISSLNIDLGREFKFLTINSLMIFSYSALSYKMLKSMAFIELWKKLKLFIIILAASSTLIMFYLNSIIFVSTKIEFFSIYYFIETLYNFTILFLLSISFLNFLYHDSKKALVLFLISFSLVSSEIVQLAYYLLIRYPFLNMVFVALQLIGLYLCFYYVKTESDSYYKLLY